MVSSHFTGDIFPDRAQTEQQAQGRIRGDRLANQAKGLEALINFVRCIFFHQHFAHLRKPDRGGFDARFDPMKPIQRTMDSRITRTLGASGVAINFYLSHGQNGICEPSKCNRPIR